MRTRNKRMLCFILTICMLCAGMYFESTKVDSLALRTPVNHVHSVIRPCEETISVGDVCTKELLCARHESLVQQAAVRRASGRNVIRITSGLLAIALAEHPFSNFYTAEDRVEFQKLHTETVILSYIHNTDGKKRI